MSLSAGTRLGPYEILGSIGAGGMGEVFRARDARLDREVALKVLPTAVATDPDRMQRFEQEARAAAALNHPNILVVHDVGAEDGVPYVVSELLEGHTLRHLLDAGALPARKATDYAAQVASGLAAAHDRGIVHRDLKPENVFVTKDGRAKILDFGLAKLVAPSSGTSQATKLQTDPGTVLGTAGYMAPEQLRGEDVDARSDIFSLGAMLYEMYAGRRAFSGRTAVETMSAILKEDPPEIGPIKGVSPAVERVIRRCLEKNRLERFQSARDVTFALEALSTATSAAHEVLPVPVDRRVRLPVAIALVVVAGVLAAAATYAAARRLALPPIQPAIKQLTFRSGTVRGARFAPDGKSVIYGAAWEGRPIELYAVREQSPESSAVSLPPADLLAISATGELAVALKAASQGPFIVAGTLARAPMAGGGARELLENVLAADWNPDGSQLAVVRAFNNPQSMRLEYPIGTTLFSAPFWISDVRVAPDASHIAFVTHPQGGDEGDVEILDVGTRDRRTLSKGWISIQGLAWGPGGREIWFTATRSGGMRALWAVSTTGTERLVFRAPQRMLLQDVTPAGRVLMAGQTMRSETQFGSIREKVERKLAWFDWATVVSLSDDARLMAFTESGEGAGEKYGVYVRPTDGSPAIRVGDGSSRAISPDGKWVAATFADGRAGIQILPIGAGEARVLDIAPLERLTGPGAVRWFADGRRLALIANEKDHNPRSYELALTGGPPKPITPEGLAGNAVSPDGRWLAVRAADGTSALFPLSGGPLKPMPAVARTDLFTGWLADSRAFLIRSAALPVQVSRVDVQSGARSPMATITVSDPSGVVSLGATAFAPDGDHYVFNYFRVLSELYIIDGLK
jgi:dipeptidyl aminopeptidase/acylaminoacyl peptidase